MTHKAVTTLKVVKCIKCVFEFGHIHPVRRRKRRSMHKADVIFFADVRERSQIGDGIFRQMVLRPFNSLLGIGIEACTRFMLDRHAVMVSNNADIHVVTGKTNTFIGIGAISDQVPKTDLPVYTVVLHGS